MIPAAIIIVALLALAGFLFWLAARVESFFYGVVAFMVLAFGILWANKLLEVLA